MELHTVLDAVDLQVQRAVAGDVAGVPLGLTDLGWSAGPVASEQGVIDQVWNHEACAGMCRAQTGSNQDTFYVGLIVNFPDKNDSDNDTDNGDAVAGGLLEQIHQLINPQLLAAGFTMTGSDKSSLLWTDGHLAVDLAVLRRIQQRTHTVPSAVQFAIYPVQSISEPVLGSRAPRATVMGSTGFA